MNGKESVVFDMTPGKRRCGRQPMTAERFWARVDRSGEGCWLWLRGVNPQGYGVLGWRHQNRLLAHRVAWTLANGEPPGDRVIMHTCDNPQCVRPEHLVAGTAAENIADRNAKGRQAKGEAAGNAVLTEDLVIEARRLWAAGVEQKEIARRFGVERTVLHRAVQRKTWRHIP